MALKGLMNGRGHVQLPGDGRKIVNAESEREYEPIPADHIAWMKRIVVERQPVSRPD
jgi:hypothetical protein